VDSRARSGGTLAFARALVATNLKAAFALRGAFWLQVVFMFLNNLIFFSFWWLAFQQIDDLAGWRLRDLCALYGLVAGAFGLSMVLGGGVRDLARSIADGELDTWLTQPKPPLLQARCCSAGGRAIWRAGAGC
jgi:ABC-2 type transport system permease protein